jgi:hypothetical protein
MYYVPFNQFKDIKYIKSGGFSKIYKTIWIDGNVTVTLKELNTKNMTYKELNEVQYFFSSYLFMSPNYSTLIRIDPIFSEDCVWGMIINPSFMSNFYYSIELNL